MKTNKCLLPECENRFSGGENLPLFCPDHNDFNNCEPDHNFVPQRYLNIFERLINKITGKWIF